jgi:tetratricopeptide (TPR) repeat protein/SAM-dependent methyltransferase
MPDINTLLTEAVRLHQAGRLDQAAPLYQKVLAQDPQNADALNLLGMVALEAGQAQASAELIRKAIAANSRWAPYHFNLALALQTMGDLDAAVASYRRVLVLKPNDSDTYNNLGNVLGAQNKFEEAIACFRRVLGTDPGNAIVLNNLGSVLRSQGQGGEAEALYRKAVALKPDYADALCNLGKSLHDKGDLAEALACYRRALAAAPHNAAIHTGLGQALWALGRRDEAMACYQKALTLDPNHVDALANLGVALWEKGQLDEADALYRRSLPMRRGDTAILNNFAGLCLARGDAGTAMDALRRSLEIKETRKAKRLFVGLVAQAELGGDNPEIRGLMTRALTEPWDRPGKLSRASADLIKFNPAIGPLVARASMAWPERLFGQALLGEAGFAPLADDGLLIALLTSAPNTDMALERFLTMARGAMGGAVADEKSLRFCGALAQQCFINEYVFLPGDAEIAAAAALRDGLVAALDAQSEIAPLQLLTVAAYFPLYALPGAAKLTERQWPAPVEAVLTQQVREPLEERRLGAEIPRLTPIKDDVSLLVRNQYEENPYPRWVRVAGGARDNIVSFLSGKFPFAAFQRQPGRAMRDFLVAGCGTGQHSISSAQKFGDKTMLAVDLSLASLSYAARKSAELGLDIHYGQADILELGALDRDFDVIESIGVLHHMADPYAGWKALLSRLRPSGFMWLGFYSEVARRNIVEARERIAARGIGTSADDIRKFRQELVEGGEAAGFASILKSEDFFSVSACRDLIFHAQEHRLTLGAIARFLRENNLTFLGFELDDAVEGAYRRRFPHDQAATDLASWEIFEQENPGMFAGMYVFWIQKA